MATDHVIEVSQVSITDKDSEQDFLAKHLAQLVVIVPPTNASIGVKWDRRIS